MNFYRRYTRDTIIVVDSQWQKRVQASKIFFAQNLNSLTAQTVEAKLKYGQMKPTQNAKTAEQKFPEALKVALTGASTQTSAEK